MAFSKTKMLGGVVGIVLAAVVLFAGYTWFALTWSYSTGDRAGYVQKFSKKGWLCKTWEGELQMIPVPGSTPEKFLFSVRDEAVARTLNVAVGRKVTLHYEQHKGVPTNCFGETEYFVTGIRGVE
ncbi:hypothetical protein [Geobacter argillaceus]|uniref:DUF3592 domain-containing protein n=2 Tax=Geobacter argillaceus TaxID=345631 RepID=A0A562VEX4_9BACT|nr:hypothetical protein [Geobacter argillaceus]TWJ16422.1 hypothetical protein JN12_03363 [Geobacter argillaceus]